jgi:hypothetical protein
MVSFKEFLAEIEKNKELINLFEHQTYKNIPGTKNSYREDPGNTNTMTSKHSHVYAKPTGRGNEIYSVNIDGSGHDGSSGKEIPSSHAEFFRNKGYSIPDDNILESLILSESIADEYELLIFEDDNA